MEEEKILLSPYTEPEEALDCQSLYQICDRLSELKALWEDLYETPSLDNNMAVSPTSDLASQLVFEALSELSSQIKTIIKMEFDNLGLHIDFKPGDSPHRNFELNLHNRIVNEGISPFAKRMEYSLRELTNRDLRTENRMRTCLGVAGEVIPFPDGSWPTFDYKLPVLCSKESVFELTEEELIKYTTLYDIVLDDNESIYEQRSRLANYLGLNDRIMNL